MTYINIMLVRIHKNLINNVLNESPKSPNQVVNPVHASEYSKKPFTHRQIFQSTFKAYHFKYLWEY